MNRLFISGIGRSGSTLIAKMVATKAQVKYTPEIPIYGFFYYWNNGRFNPLLESQVSDYLKWYSQLYAEHPWHLDREALVAQVKTQSFDDYMNALSLAFFESNQAEIVQNTDWIIDKNPSYTLFLNYILKKNTKDKCIFIVRDPRDNAASRIKTKNRQNTRNEHVAMHALRWKRFNAEYARLTRQFPDRVLLVKYESFIEHTDEELQKMSAFLNVSFQSSSIAMASYTDSHIQGLDASIQKKYADLAKPINRNAIGQWKEILSEEQLSLIEGICGPLMQAFGYEISKPQAKPIVLKYRILEFCYWLKEKILFYTPVKIKLSRIKSLTRKSS